MKGKPGTIFASQVRTAVGAAGAASPGLRPRLGSPTMQAKGCTGFTRSELIQTRVRGSQHDSGRKNTTQLLKTQAPSNIKHWDKREHCIHLRKMHKTSRRILVRATPTPVRGRGGQSLAGQLRAQGGTRLDRTPLCHRAQSHPHPLPLPLGPCRHAVHLTCTPLGCGQKLGSPD